MDPQSIFSAAGVRDVVCMFCAWTWMTGTPADTAAVCPRCKHKAGVEAFAVMSPEKKGFAIVSAKPVTPPPAAQA